jgi:hypothetical protein
MSLKPLPKTHEDSFRLKREKTSAWFHENSRNKRVTIINNKQAVPPDRPLRSPFSPRADGRFNFDRRQPGHFQRAGGGH